MAQNDFGAIDTANTSGAEFANLMELHRDAVNSMHKGATRPAYAVNGTVWIDDSSGDWVVKLYNATLGIDIQLGTYDVESASFIAEGGGGGGVIDQADLFANLSNFDGEAQGFVFFATDTGDAYVKNSASSGDWSDAFTITGPPGEDGDISLLLAAATPEAVTDDATLELNVGSGNNLSFSITISQDTVVDFPINVPNNGIVIDLHVTQDGTGGWDVTFPGGSGFWGSGGVNPTPAQDADAETLYTIKIFTTSPAKALVVKAASDWSLLP